MFKVLKSFYLFFLLIWVSTAPVMAACPPLGTIVPGSVPISDQSQVAMDNAGNSYIIWKYFDGANTNVVVNGTTIPGSPAPGDYTTANPQIAVNPATGDAVAIWLDGSTIEIKSAQLPFGGSWTTPVILSSAPSSSLLLTSQIAINSQGYAVAVWKEFNGGTQKINSRTLQFGGSWSPVLTLVSTATDFVQLPQVGVDAAGNATAIWQNITSGSIDAGYLPFGSGSWTITPNISNTTPLDSIGQPDLAVDPSGYAVATWPVTGFIDTIQAASSINGSWSLPLQVSTLPTVNDPSVAITPSTKRAIITWTQGIDGSHTVIQSSELPFGGSAWSAPIFVSPLTVPSSFAFNSKVAYDGQGNAYAVWFVDKNFSSDAIIETATLIVGTSSWQPPASCDISAIGDTSNFPSIAMNALGLGVIAWTNSTFTPLTALIQSTQLIAPLAISSVVPDSGSTSGGNTVVINGTGFYDLLTNTNIVTGVDFGGNPATILFFSPNQLIVIAPPNAVIGPVNVSVTTSTPETSPSTTTSVYSYDSPICWQR